MVGPELDFLESRCSLQIAHMVLFLAHVDYAGQQCQASSDVFEVFVNAMTSLELNSG